MADSPNDNTDGVLEVDIKTGGTPLPDDFNILSVKVRSEMGRIPEANIVLVAGDIANNTFDEADGPVFEQGQEIEIAAGYDGGGTKTLFKGVITAKRMRITLSQGPRLEITARDKAIALTQIRKSMLFEANKDQDVMKGIIWDAGLTADIAATNDAARDQLQVDCTDWDFLRCIADRVGHVVTISDGTVTSAPPASKDDAVLTVTLGVDILSFDAAIDTQNLLSKASGRAWDVDEQKAVEGKGAKLLEQEWGSDSARKLAESVVVREMSFATSRHLDTAELRTMSDARLARSVLSSIQGRCSFRGSEKAKPGKVLEIKDVGDRFGGNALISGVEHVIEQGEWRSAVTLGLPDRFTADQPGFGGSGPQALTAPIDGLHIGKVVALSQDPAGHQRIKLTLPMITAEGATVWARFAQPYASKEAGIQFMPEIDDEVVVGFLSADPHAPVVLGALHNTKAAQVNPPQDEKNALKVIATRERLKLEFDDEKKIITLETPGGHNLTLDDHNTEMRLEDSNGNTLVMGPGGIDIDSAGDVNITASKAINIQAGLDLAVEGVNVSCKGQAGFTAEGGASAELKAGGQTTVKGAMVMIN